ncbi:hypothetical protein O181_011641 [Austropuccinia psidii MF-1]|uniref:Uncharacterized protein n=1 Tax=Austropuccinia psidii MF-1 TaxID=1389203 RepID=A0A9Q3GLI6_9BASI|nr:hypothetical protein [Austropuccinia psidii MF-1]
MLIFVHGMTSTPPSDHLTPLPCLLSHMNCLPHPRRLPCLHFLRALNIYLQFHPHPPLCFCTPTVPSRNASDTSTPPHLLCSLSCLWSCIRAIGYMTIQITEIC